MELPRISKSEGGLLDGIKSKLGFADPNQGYDDRYYDDEEGFDDYGGFEDYGEYGPDYREGDLDPVDPPASRYEPHTSVSTRPARSSARGGASSAKLVSIDDVRAHTQVPDSLNRDPLPPRRVTSSGSYRGERTMVDASQPVHASAPTARATAASSRERSESLNSLFTATTGDGSTASALDSLPPLTAGAGATVATATASSLDSYAPARAASQPLAARPLLVLKPASYGEVERVAGALKAGNVVVLALRNTPDNLAKRILDFSFGVSSALDASVDCVAEKVFVITRGSALTDAERTNLRNQGVL